MASAHDVLAQRRTVLCLGLLLLGVILTAGLWPFHLQANNVGWEENGLEFGRHGMVLSTDPFRETPGQDNRSCSLEILLEPATISGESTILAFDSSADPRLPFSLRQLGENLAIQRYTVDGNGIARRPWLKVDHVFRLKRRTLVTITSGGQNTLVYTDEALAATSSTLGFASTDMTGRLVLGTSTVDDSWTGQIAGLAIYPRQLSQEQVQSHFESWNSERAPITSEETPVALYRFNERGGNRVRNLMGPGPDLVAPDRYSVLHPAYLRMAWGKHEYGRYVWTRWSFWQDALLNIAGFMPVGFLLLAYLSSGRSVRPISQLVLAAVFIGFCLSLSIESLQFLLPTRDSDLTDIITNTTGSYLGALLYRSGWGQVLWSRVVRRTNVDQELCRKRCEAAMVLTTPSQASTDSAR